MDPVVEFRPLQLHDLPRLHAWFDEPHARRWFRRHEGTLAELEQEYTPSITGVAPNRCFIVVIDGQDAGMFEWVRLGDFPDVQLAYGVEDPDTANCDVLLHQAVAHGGLGPIAIRAFVVREIFADPRITSCVIDPESENFIAIRAYEKAGFRFVRAMPDDCEGSSVHLLELTRADLSTPPAQAPFTIRPMRENELELACEIDEDAARAFADVGLSLDALPESFVDAERMRWARSLGEGRALVACAASGEAIGFVVFGLVGGAPYVHQVSVRRAWTKRGVGRALMARAKQWCVRAGELWLTTYEHVPWNGPFYERLGFSRVDECNADIRALLDADRATLPEGSRQIAMRFRHR